MIIRERPPHQRPFLFVGKYFFLSLFYSKFGREIQVSNI